MTATAGTAGCMRLRRCGAALAAAAALLGAATACSDAASSTVGVPGIGVATAPQGGKTGSATSVGTVHQPLVETMPLPAADVAWLDPDADPRTPAGEARARRLPLWTPDLDAAFPPAVCGSALELDAIAVSAPDADIRAYGEPAAMAALAVMRYEHLVSRAMAAPSPLAQLCIAVATLEPARSEALDALVHLMGADARRDGGLGSTGPLAARDLLDAPCTSQDGRHGSLAAVGPQAGCTAAFPRAVVVLALSPSSALAAACVPATAGSEGSDAAVSAGAAASIAADDAVSGGSASPEGALAMLRAYELVPARGIEDTVIDISYRVARISERPAADCAGEAAWAAEWEQQVRQWIAEGQVWLPVGKTVTPDDLCAAGELPVSAGCSPAWGTRDGLAS